MESSPADESSFVGAFDGPQSLSSSLHLGTRSASAAHFHTSWQGSSGTSRSSTGSFGALGSLYDGNTVLTTPTSSRSRETFLDLSTEPSIDEATQSITTSHNHWCFICPNPRVITTCDGWKRHMKEHETRYRCMPRGPIEYSSDGAKCAFCGFQNPSQSHCDTHKAFTCASKSLDVRSYTRRPHFISHLNTHEVSNVLELANHWRDTNNKKHFSCGFCISHFNTLIEQLNHIDNDHYRHFQDIRHWDSNKVIRGLLLQPGVSESWRRILASHPGLTESFLRWELSVVKDLQFKLELGNESADDLARLAFNKSIYDLTHQGEGNTFDGTGLSWHNGIAAPQQPSVIQGIPPTPFNLRNRPVVDKAMITSLAFQMEPCAVTDNCMSPHNRSALRGEHKVAGDYAAMGMQHPQLDTGLNLMTNGEDYRNYTEPRLSTPWESPKSVDSVSATPNSMTMGNYWQGTSVLSPSNSSIFPGQPSYQSHHNMGKDRVRYTDQNFPPQKASPLMQSSAVYAKPSLASSQPRKQPSRSKLKSHYDINTEADIDFDMDFLQRFMREEDSTRSERRRC